jgi:hypothetical protein
VSEAGYSGTPLQQKLGLREGMRVAFVGDVPEGLAERFTGVETSSRLTKDLDAIHLFVKKQSELQTWGDKALGVLGDKGMLWVSWPKKSSGVPTDLTENVLRHVLLPTGWVDTKVCAVDDVWSGLKFVKRLANRANPA